MNTKWLKNNALLLGFVTVFLVVVGALVWLQQGAAAKVQEIDNSLAEQVSQLSHLHELKPPPTRENIDVFKQNRQELEHLYSDLLSVVSRSQIQTQAFVRPVGFLQLMASRFARLRQNAEKAKVKLPDGFAFGFSRYAGPPPTLPARGLSEAETTNVLTQLTKQMAAIEKLSDLLIQSRPDEISQIRRAEVEPGSPSQDAMDITVSNKGLYDVLPFEFRFVGTTDALRAFLNNLSQSEWFFAVRSVQVAGEQPAAPTGANEAVIAAAAAKRSVLTVTIRVDLIEFPQQSVSKPKT
jgi:hypothetical protein